MSGKREDRPAGQAPPAADYVFVDRLHSTADRIGADEVARILSGSTGPVAVDVERASGIRYADRAFLVQIRVPDGPAYLLDPETMGRSLGPVARELSRRTLLLHAASQDLPSLRELDVRPGDLVDTELAGRFLGLERVNLGAMVSEFLGISLTKAHSSADWSRRPLPETWLDYAAYDVLVLHELAEVLLSRLDEAGRLDWFVDECAYVAVADPVEVPSEPWRRLSRISSLRTTRQLARARALWLARDEAARQRDIAPKRLLPDTGIIAAAVARPHTAAELLAIDGFAGPQRSRLAGHWLAAMDAADALPDTQLPDRSGPPGPHPPHTTWKRIEPEAAELLTMTRDAVGELAEELDVEAGLLLKPSTLRLWVWRAVTDPDTEPEQILAAVLEEERARPWQRRLCSPVLLAALREFEHGG